MSALPSHRISYHCQLIATIEHLPSLSRQFFLPNTKTLSTIFHRNTLTHTATADDITRRHSAFDRLITSSKTKAYRNLRRKQSDR